MVSVSSNGELQPKRSGSQFRRTWWCSVATLALHAGIIAEQARDFTAVRRYYELAAEYDPKPWTYLALGDACGRLGDNHAAQTHYATGQTMAENGSDPDVLALLRQRIADG